MTTSSDNKSYIINYCVNALENLSNNYFNTTFKRINFSLYDVRAYTAGNPSARYVETVSSGESIVNFIYHPIRYLSYKEMLDSLSSIETPQKTLTQVREIKTNQILTYPPSENLLPNRIKQIVIFGDSLSDQGNLKYKTGHIPDFPYWFGRFSDGFIWPDYLYKSTNIPILNFSYGGATTANYNHIIAEGLKLWGQALIAGNLENYLDHFNREINILNTNFGDDKLEDKAILHNAHETLYIIWMGANDFLSVLNSNIFVNKFFDEPDSEYGKNTIIKTSFSSAVYMIRYLIEKGAQNFTVINLPNIGYTPYVLTSTYRQGILGDNERYKEFSMKLTQVIDEYNELLKNEIAIINNEIDNKIIMIDVNKQLNNMLYGIHMHDQNQSFDYGFSYLNSQVPIPNQDNLYIQKPCFSGDTMGNITILSYLIPNLNKTIEDFERKKICSDNPNAKKFKSNKYAIFWDNPHPSSYTHCFLAHFIQKSLEDKDIIKKSNVTLEQVKSQCREIVKYNFNIN